jgi:4-aminobutyrate aminotransferase
VTNAKLGHCHPKVSKAAADQCVNLVHAQVCFQFKMLAEELTPILF